jgi:hypothetical protein
MGVRATITGNKELAAGLRQAAQQMRDLRVPNSAAAARIAIRARTLCPVKTGRLQASIQLEVDPTTARVVAGQGIPYANAQHWGYPPHNIPATLFLTRALTETQPQWTVDYQQAIDAIVARV